MKPSYIKTQLSNIINISKIVTIHYYEFDSSFIYDGEKHDFWELVYIDKGQVEIQCDNKKIILSQGEIVFHCPNEFHAIRALNSNPNFFVISFVSNSAAMTYFEKLHTTLDNNLKSFLSSLIVEAEQTFEIHKNDPQIKQLSKKYPSAIGGEQLVKTYLEQFLIYLIRYLTEKKKSSIFPTKENMENHLVSSMKQFIESKTNEVFYINELCQEIGYSKSFLCKLFHEQTGESIAAYATKVKIKAARRLIREGNLNFAQISEELAFESPQYFCRVFKRVMDMTPTEYKASLQFKN